MGVDWNEISETMATARATQPPALQASWDQALADLERQASEHRVDLTDPAQARAAMVGASLMLNTLKAMPLWPLCGAPWFETTGLTALAMIASFIPKEPV